MVRILAGMVINNLIDAKVKASAQTISKDESKLGKYFLIWGIGSNQLWLKFKLNPMEIRVRQNDINIKKRYFDAHQNQVYQDDQKNDMKF